MMQLLPGKPDIDTNVSDHRIKQGSRHSFTKSRRSHPLSVPAPVLSTVTSSTRVYKAPQALVRNDNYVNSKQASSSVGTRRRRPTRTKDATRHLSTTASSTTTTEINNNLSSSSDGGAMAIGFLMDHESDSSLGNADELPAPPLWGDEDDAPKISPYSRKKDSAIIPEIAWARSPPSRSNSRNSPTHIRQGCDDYSENTLGEEELFAAYETHLHTHLHTHDHTNRCCPPGGTTFKKQRGTNGSSNNNGNATTWCAPYPYANVIQFCVLLILAFLVFDSHHRVHKHKIQLQEYDEERAHILEQMMWIDQAAKRVHKKYSTQQGGSSATTINTNGPDVMSQMKGSDDSARAALEKLQLRIQLNARDRLEQRFGDKPAEISLKLNNQGEHLIVALSDDTPHAVSILLEQVERRVWDNIRVEKASAVGAVQIASAKAATTPLLEFVEPSRGCHEVGSVAIRQQEEDELHVLKLRVNLIANSPMDPGDVCIGRAVSSLVTLQEMARAL